MYSKQLIIDVAAGNFGALKIVMDMMYFNKWFSMMKLLKERNITGEKLYLTFKEEYRGSILGFGEWLKKELAKESIKANIKAKKRVKHIVLPSNFWI